MSIKTLRKRIALVAVSALGAGFLSVAPAFATAGDITLIATTSTGLCAATNAAGTTQDITVDTNKSTAASPLTVTVAVGGTVDLTTLGTEDNVTYTAGGIVSTATLASGPTLQAGYGVYSGADSGSNAFTLSANAVGSVTLNTYLDASAPFTSGVPNASFSAPTGTIYISVVATCSATLAPSLSKSSASVSDAYSATPAWSDGDLLSYGAGDRAYFNIIGKNGFGQVLPATTSWVAQATNGALVKIGTGATIDDLGTLDGTSSIAITTAAGTNISVRVAPANDAVGGSTTVTVSAQGVVIISRTITFAAEGASIAVVKQLTGKSGGEGAFLYNILDASGKPVAGSISADATTYGTRVNLVTNIKSATVVASDVSPATNAVGVNDINGVVTDTILGVGTATYGIAKFSCLAAGGSGDAKVTLKHTQAITAAVKTLEVTLKCAGDMDTYTVSTDKATYKVGEVMTVTISAKDSSGVAVNDFAQVGAAPSVTAGGGTVVKAAAVGDTFTGGKKTYEFQMTTAGAFNVAAVLAGATTKSATAAYTVTSSEVSNAEVLAAIVKLIASINKQIKALQKSLRR